MITDRKRRNYYEKAFYEMLLEGKLTGTVLDPDRALTKKISEPGLYNWFVRDIETGCIVSAYTGETEDLYLRTLQHLKHWLYNEQSLHYLGIEPSELGTKYLLELHVHIDPAGIAYENAADRKKAEAQQIELLKPYTQWTENKQVKIYPGVPDSCLWHRYRRKAFLAAMENAI